MKPNFNVIFATGLAAVLTSCATRPPSEAEGGPRYYYAKPAPSTTNPGPGAPRAAAPPATTVESSETPWPRTVNSGSTTLTIYEPQVDSWDGHALVARNAVGIKRSGQSEPTYGVVTLHAITLVNKSSRNVSLENIRLDGGDFPSARESSQDYMKLLRDNFPKTLDGLSLDRLQISLVVPPEQLKGSTQLNNTPPKIIFSTTPAILVYVDGPPAYRAVSGTDLQRVINTRVLLLKDKDGQHYLHLWDGYLTSPGLEGPWTIAAKPQGAAEAERQVAVSQMPVDAFNQQAEGATNAPPSLDSNAAPEIYVATQPTELIVFNGDPNFVPMNGTHLLYVANTTGNVFRLLTDQQNYVLISGRWFRGPSLDGPWQFVPATRLASDFANIPDNSPKENVKASVPGTQQATEALLANSIPDSAAFPRNTQMQPPQIDGPPELRPIGGTPLYYVANTGTPIIKVDEQSWFACENGVWYGATSINGPWAVADSVPAVIYTIPPGSPLHYLTYVRVYGANSEVVYTGYTPGYLGTEVEDGVVVYGSGYYYSPWVGSVWYGYPVSWGFGWGPCWTPWYDWCFAFGFGWGWWGGWGCHPWWGGWHHHGLVATARPNSFSTARSIYPRTGRTTPGTRSIARSDSRAGFARAYNSRTGTIAAGQRATVQNVPNHTQSRSVVGNSRSTRPMDTRIGNVSRYGGSSGNLRGANSFSRGAYGPNFPSRQYPGGAYGYSRGGGPGGSMPGRAEGGRSIAGGGGGRSGGGEGHSTGGGGGGGGHPSGGGGGGGGGAGGGHSGGGGGGGRGQR